MDLCNDHLSQMQFSAELVANHLSKLCTRKGAGSDGIPPYFWFNCAKSLSVPISYIFNRSLRESVFPLVWKIALIVPVHKKGSRLKVENYRGISILNTLAKVFEKIVYNAVYPILVKGIPNTQHGFLARRSCVSNLACFSNFVLSNMDHGGQVDVIYTDFEKAFDRVDHSILLNKLENLGIHGDLLRWIKSYLSNRSQATVVGGYRSDFISIPTGVPQGSHLGPLFYNVYLHDIYDCFNHSKHLMYADDKKIFVKIRNINDCLLLQDDLDVLSNYYANNSITVNVEKCQCISFSRKKKPLNFPYNFDGTIINRTENVRDLGVHFDPKYALTNHIEHITARAYKNLGFVMRSCEPFNDVNTLKIVYFAYVRSILEYASPIWSPQYIIYKEQLERIQRKFIKHLNFRTRKPSVSYLKDCRRYNLLTLEERRTVMDMCLLYDILRGRLDCPELLSAVSLLAPKRRTRHTPLLYVPVHATNYASNAPLSRIARTYNKTFHSIDLFTLSKPVFKNMIIQLMIK